MTITMGDIARQAGVTKTTVSMVFRNRPGISEVTRRRVFDLAKELGYAPSADRQRRGRVHHGQIGLLFVGNDPPRLGGEHGAEYFLGILRGVQSQAEKGNCSVVFCSAIRKDLDDGKIPSALWRQSLDGLLIRGRLDPKLADWLEQKEIRHVLIDCTPDTRGHDIQVNIDNIDAMRKLADHLVQRGCRKFATITGELSHINGRERLAGLQTALMHHGLELPSQNIFLGSEFNEAAGRDGVRELLQRGVDFDALVCQNDLIAAEAMKSLATAGRQVPGDVKVTGFDNMTFGSMLSIPLTTIDSRPAQIGQLGVQLLLSQLDTDRPPEPLCVRVPTELIARHSSV